MRYYRPWRAARAVHEAMTAVYDLVIRGGTLAASGGIGPGAAGSDERAILESLSNRLAARERTGAPR